jgi:hypothetical protein
LKLRELILSWGEPGKQKKQFVTLYTMSIRYCAIAKSFYKNELDKTVLENGRVDGKGEM